LLIADSERMADCGPHVDRAERRLWRLRRAIAEVACRGAYCLYLALNDTHSTRWRCSCLVQFGDRKRPTNCWPARATDGTFTRAEAALRADPRRRLCGYSVCRTAEVLARADQRAGPSAPAMAMAMARASSSRSVPPRRARSCWAASCPPCRWAPGRRWSNWRALRLPASDRAARRRRDPHPRDGAPVTASASACSGPTPLEHRLSRRLQRRGPHLAH